MFRKNRIQELFGIQHPIIQAPMVGCSSTALVAAVSNAGALGSFGAAALSPEKLRETIQQIREQTNQPFNINLFASASEYDSVEGGQVELEPGPAFSALLSAYHGEADLGSLPQPKQIFGPADEQLNVLIEQQVPIISFHFGVTAAQVAAIHSANLKVICSATTVAEAIDLEALGVDAVIAQGAEAGGHRGTYLPNEGDALVGSLALTPQVVDAVNIPVISAGGIMDGRGIAACAALGASGVQMGTAFLGCDETPIHELWRDRLTRSNATQTQITSAISGKPARGLRNRYMNEVEALGEPLLPYPLHYSMSGPLRQAAAKNSNPDFMVMWSGQGVSMFRRMPVATLINTLLDETETCISNLAQ